MTSDSLGDSQRSEHPLTRQIRLAEVGIDGQARLAAAQVEVRGRDGSLAEFLYLHRAGIERVELRPDRPAQQFVHAGLFQHPEARRLAAGAWRALAQMRLILALTSESR